MLTFRHLFRGQPTWAALSAAACEVPIRACLHIDREWLAQDGSEEEPQQAPQSANRITSQAEVPAAGALLPFGSFATSAVVGAGTRGYSKAILNDSHIIEHTPVSRAIALMVSQDSIPRDRLVMSMSKLCSEMTSTIREYSTTEVAAFCEASKQMDFCTQALADAVIDFLPERVAELTGEELPGVLWVVAKKDDVDLLLARDLCEAVDAHLEELRPEDLPSVIPVVAALCPASPFLLTSLSDLTLAKLPEFSATELTLLVEVFGSELVRRSLFDDKIFKGLAAAVEERVREFTLQQLRKVLQVYRHVCARHHNLVATLSHMEAELVPFTSPTPQ